jgi:hypothetical protein
MILAEARPNEIINEIELAAAARMKVNKTIFGEAIPDG